MSDLRTRLFSRLMIQPNGCVVWTGAKSHGYGYIRVGYRTVGVHRVMWEMFEGPIPDGLTLDHLCRNKLCANLSHLEPVTAGENAIRAIAGLVNDPHKLFCVHGHPRTPENTRIKSTGRRSCWVCHYSRRRRG